MRTAFALFRDTQREQGELIIVAGIHGFYQEGV